MVTESRHNAIWAIPESTDGRRNIINPVELIGSLAALWTYRDLDRGRRVLLFQDNSTAFTLAISGYSESDIVREVAGLFHLSAAARNLSLWIEHTQTDAMLVDIPSRNSGFGHHHEAKLSAPRYIAATYFLSPTRTLARLRRHL
jgi:hypothetical protein